MRYRRIIRVALGLFVIAHGLAQAVFPMRGLVTPAALTGGDAMPNIIYAVATVGFIVGGLGILGLTPFTAAARPALVLASAYSLVGLSRIWTPDLWFGAIADMLLLLVGLTGIYQHLPQPAAGSSRWRHAVAEVAAAAFIAYVICAGVLWPFHRAWG